MSMSCFLFLRIMNREIKSRKISSQLSARNPREECRNDILRSDQSGGFKGRIFLSGKVTPYCMTNTKFIIYNALFLPTHSVVQWAPRNNKVHSEWGTKTLIFAWSAHLNLRRFLSHSRCLLYYLFIYARLVMVSSTKKVKK